VYQLLPPRETLPLLDRGGAPVDEDLHDPTTWERHGWGPHSPGFVGRDRLARTEFVHTSLARARAFHEALARPPGAVCPATVTVIGGDCLPTLGRALLDGAGRPHFEPRTQAEARLMFEAGDGRVTRASALASHLAPEEAGCGLPEASETFFGAADHHGIYAEPTFQSILLRRLLRPVRQPSPALG
jgi:hypothetical protein